MSKFFKRIFGKNHNSSTQSNNLIEETEPITIQRYGIIDAKLHEIYDGDTAKFIVSRDELFPSSKIIVNVRFVGFNAPELKPRKNTSCDIDLEKNAGKVAKEIMENKLKSGKILLNLQGTDVWGRFLANVLIDGNDVSDYMIERNCGISYDGKGKAPQFTIEQLEKCIRSGTIE